MLRIPRSRFTLLPLVLILCGWGSEQTQAQGGGRPMAAGIIEKVTNPVPGTNNNIQFGGSWTNGWNVTSVSIKLYKLVPVDVGPPSPVFVMGDGCQTTSANGTFTAFVTVPGGGTTYISLVEVYTAGSGLQVWAWSPNSVTP